MSSNEMLSALVAFVFARCMHISGMVLISVVMLAAVAVGMMCLCAIL